jgi:hypothetical protein
MVCVPLVGTGDRSGLGLVLLVPDSAKIVVTVQSIAKSDGPTTESAYFSFIFKRLDRKK